MSAGLASGQLGRWTRYFTVASALSLVATEVVVVLGGRRTLVATIALFGFVCPMIFGMAYILIPSIVGRTLADYRFPGIHFVLAYGGATGLIVGRLLERRLVARVGVTLWSLGVIAFLGVLAWTVVPALRERPEAVLRSGDRPQRSTRVATAAIAVSLGYLLMGTIGLANWAGLGLGPDVGFPAVVHLYGAGFGALLVFGLGARLMPGFFHVTPPRGATWLVLGAGAIGPGLLAWSLWSGAPFQVGAVLQSVAMLGYAGVVGVVFWRSEWRRPALYGILLGAMAGAVAVMIAAPVAFGTAVSSQFEAHTMAVVSGFFGLTIIGYASQFFAIPNGQFRGASPRVAIGTMLALAVGTLLHVSGALIGRPMVVRGGTTLLLLGAVVYAFLISRRLFGK